MMVDIITIGNHFVYKGHHHNKPRIAQPKEIILCVQSR